MAEAVLDAGGGEAFAAGHDRVDAILISQTLKRTRGNQLQAALMLGVSRPALRRRCASLGIPTGGPGGARPSP